MKRLLIVESPGKLKTLKKILSQLSEAEGRQAHAPDATQWSVEASIGHLTALANSGPKRWGFQFEESGVHCDYELRDARAQKTLAKLKQVCASIPKQEGAILLAMDPDREGEAIAWHIARLLKLSPKNFKRIQFTQITARALKEALANPRTLNDHLIEAQRARQCLDKLVGFEVSPMLKASTGGKSAGRVQSIALHFVCERERERLKFEAKTYWVIKALYQGGLEAQFVGLKNPVPKSIPQIDESHGSPSDAKDSKTKDVGRLFSREEVVEILAKLKAHTHIIESIKDEEQVRRAPPPFVTSTLQQYASSRLRFSPERSMRLAQDLYEAGHITYMRTDSPSLSAEAVEAIRAQLKLAGVEYLPDKPNVFAAKGAAQEAHEAIRPSKMDFLPANANATLDADQLKLYELIWKRTMACQATASRVAKTTISIGADVYLLEALGSRMVFDGWQKFWDYADEDVLLPSGLKEKQNLSVEKISDEERKTQPPPRYSEAKLIQLMEAKGVGRPSTYASTIKTIKEREYVVLEKSLLLPTPLGLKCDEFLMQNVSRLVNVEFTARMEDSLDEIAEGKRDWSQYLKDFYEDFKTEFLSKAANPPEQKPRGFFSEEKSEGMTSWKPHSELPENLQLLLEKGYKKAKKAGALPVCTQGHGALDLRISKNKKLYWKCTHPGCEDIAWYQDFSSFKCPACQSEMEKVPSKKVKGGNFLKCTRTSQHPDQKDVVVFRNRETGEWELPGAATGSFKKQAQGSTASASRTPAPVKPVREAAYKTIKPPFTLTDQHWVVLGAIARLNGLPKQGVIPFPLGSRFSGEALCGFLRAEISGWQGVPLTGLKSFGVFKDMTVNQVQSLIDECITHDALRFRPSEGALVVSDYGAELLVAEVKRRQMNAALSEIPPT